MLFQVPVATKYYPPKGFTGAERSSFVNFCDQPQFAATKGKEKGSKKRGLDYQAKVENYLEKSLVDPWVPIFGPWIEYADETGKFKYAQPDVIILNPTLGRVVIAEIKLTRVPMAWWQLNRKYRPLVVQLFPKWEIAMVEIVSQVYAVAVPESVTLIQRIDQAQPLATSLIQVPFNV